MSDGGGSIGKSGVKSKHHTLITRRVMTERVANCLATLLLCPHIAIPGEYKPCGAFVEMFGIYTR
jgi:hypothetical protein